MDLWLAYLEYSSKYVKTSVVDLPKPQPVVFVVQPILFQWMTILSVKYYYNLLETSSIARDGSKTRFSELRYFAFSTNGS